MPIAMALAVVHAFASVPATRHLGSTSGIAISGGSLKEASSEYAEQEEQDATG